MNSGTSHHQLNSTSTHPRHTDKPHLSIPQTPHTHTHTTGPRTHSGIDRCCRDVRRTSLGKPRQRLVRRCGSAVLEPESILSEIGFETTRDERPVLAHQECHVPTLVFGPHCFSCSDPVEQPVPLCPPLSHQRQRPVLVSVTCIGL